MKYVSLKNILGKSLICALAITLFAATNVSAETTKEAQEKAMPSKPMEMAEALSILNMFKKYITAFFNKNNTEKYTQHVNKFGFVVDQIKNFAHKINQKYKATKSEKYKQLLIIIQEIRNDAADIYNTLNQKYNNSLSLAYALRKATSEHTAPAKLKALENKLNELKQYLTPEEANILRKFIETLKNIDENIPKNQLAQLARINKVWKNQ